MPVIGEELSGRQHAGNADEGVRIAERCPRLLAGKVKSHWLISHAAAFANTVYRDKPPAPVDFPGIER